MGRLNAPVLTTSRMIAPTMALKESANPIEMISCEVEKLLPDQAEDRFAFTRHAIANRTNPEDRKRLASMYFRRYIASMPQRHCGRATHSNTGPVCNGKN